MRDRAQPLCLKAVLAQQAYHVRKALGAMHKAKRAARSAQERCRAADILQRTQHLAARRGLIRVRAELAASGGKVRWVRHYEVKLPGLELIPAAADIADDDIAARIQRVRGNVLARNARSLGVQLKPRHMQCRAPCQKQQRQYARAAAEVDAPAPCAYIHKIGQQHGVRAQPEMLRLLKLRPVFPQFHFFRGAFLEAN